MPAQHKCMLLAVPVTEVERAKAEIAHASGIATNRILSMKATKNDDDRCYHLCHIRVGQATFDRVIVAADTFSDDCLVLDCTGLNPIVELHNRGFTPRCETDEETAKLNSIVSQVIDQIQNRENG